MFIIIFVTVFFVGMHFWMSMLSNQIIEDQKQLTKLNSTSVVSSTVNDDKAYYTKDLNEKQKQIKLLKSIGFR